MSEAPDDRCGYTWPEDFDLDGDPSPDTQNSCCRRSLSDADRCVWHVHPARTEKKTIGALQRARTDPEIREQTKPFVEILDGVELAGCEIEDSISLSSVSLREADLSATLTSADLTNALLHRADLSNADLRHAKMSGAEIREASLAHADLNDADLSNADLSGSAFILAHVRRADLQRADLTNTSFFRADLSEAHLQEADLGDADLRDAQLRKTNLSEANLSDANLSRANLSEADLSSAVLLDADLNHADFRGSDLWGVNLVDTLVYYADFTNADLENAVLTNAVAHGTDFTGANLTGANLSDLTIDASTDTREIHAADLPNRQPSDDENHGILLAVETAAHYLKSARWRDNNATDPQGAKLTHRKIRSRLDDLELPSDIPYHYIRSKQARRREAIKNREYQKWLTLSLSRWVTLYGESPWRVVYTSAAVMLGCALAYPYLGGIEFVADSGGFAGPNWLKPLYFSVITFTTLGYGDVRPVGEAAQLLSMGESLIGAALIALLVAVLSRRITR